MIIEKTICDFCGKEEEETFGELRLVLNFPLRDGRNIKVTSEDYNDVCHECAGKLLPIIEEFKQKFDGVKTND